MTTFVVFTPTIVSLDAYLDLSEHGRRMVLATMLAKAGIVMQLGETMMDAWMRDTHEGNGLPYVKGQVHPDLLKALTSSQQALDWMYLLNGCNPL